jgi:hypothetical protein
MSMICSFLIRIYIVLVNVEHCCQNWLWLLYARTPVLLCVDRLPCLRFRTHQNWFYGPESKHVLLCLSRIYIVSRFFYVPFFSFRELCQSHLCSSRSYIGEIANCQLSTLISDDSLSRFSQFLKSRTESVQNRITARHQKSYRIWGKNLDSETRLTQRNGSLTFPTDPCPQTNVPY